MESTPAIPVLTGAVGSLAAAFAALPDTRRAASVCYPLPAILALAVAALLAGQHSVLAITQWIARQEAAQLEALGFPPGRVPAQSTLHRILGHLDLDALVRQVQISFAPITAPASDGLQGIAIDGKVQRGRHRFTGWDYAVHAVCAVCHGSGLVVAHEPVAADPLRRDTELPAARRLLARLDWTGRVLTGDRLYCCRPLCQQVCAAGGDYLLAAGRNRPRLSQALTALFGADHLPDLRTTRTEETGHGRRQERRELRLTADVASLGDWPGVQQAFHLVRTWRERGQEHTAVSYGITSLSPTQAGPETILRLRREHWTIENRLHRQKDVHFGEDASQIRCGVGPAVLATLRDTAITLLYHDAPHHLAARTRVLSQFPHRALAMVCRPLPARA
jgi:predicted transposase YbfD/YdcC